jgi:hypothetical protein
MDSKISKYKVLGKIYIWKYKENKRNFPGWNLTVNNEGSKSLLNLLELLESSQYPSRKRVMLSEPTSKQLGVPNNRGGNARYKPARVLELRFKKFNNEEIWRMAEQESVVILEFGTNKMRELKSAIAGVPEGKGDFGICDAEDENVLFFWWNLDK